MRRVLYTEKTKDDATCKTSVFADAANPWDTSLTNFKRAFQEYLADPTFFFGLIEASAAAKYVPIEDWDVSRVNRTEWLFDTTHGNDQVPGASIFNADSGKLALGATVGQQTRPADVSAGVAMAGEGRRQRSHAHG